MNPTEILGVGVSGKKHLESSSLCVISHLCYVFVSWVIPSSSIDKTFFGSDVSPPSGPVDPRLHPTLRLEGVPGRDAG